VTPQSVADAANRATSLWAYDGAEVLEEAFRAHRLDPQNPWNWRGLLYTLATGYHGIKPKGGRPPKWRRQQFVADHNDAVVTVREQGRSRHELSAWDDIQNGPQGRGSRSR
jgi:hypothetical protein